MPAAASAEGWRIVGADRSARRRAPRSTDWPATSRGSRSTRTLDGAERKRRRARAAARQVDLEDEGAAQGTLEIGGAVPASQNVVVAASTREGLLVVARRFVADLDQAGRRLARARSARRSAARRSRTLRVAAAGGPTVELVRGRPTASRVDRALRRRRRPRAGRSAALRPGRPARRELPRRAAGAGGRARAWRRRSGGSRSASRGAREPLVVELGGEVAPGGNRYVRVGRPGLRGEDRARRGAGARRRRSGARGPGRRSRAFGSSA